MANILEAPPNINKYHLTKHAYGGWGMLENNKRNNVKSFEWILTCVPAFLFFGVIQYMNTGPPVFLYRTHLTKWDIDFMWENTAHWGIWGVKMTPAVITGFIAFWRRSQNRNSHWCKQRKSWPHACTRGHRDLKGSLLKLAGSYRKLKSTTSQ